MQQPMTAPSFGEKKIMAGLSGLVAQPVSPKFKMDFTLLAKRVVEGDKEVLGSMSRFSLVKRF